MGELWKNLRELWSGMSRVARMAFVGAVGASVILAAWLFVWAERSNDQVLFSDLDARDAAAIVDELKKMKVPYRIGEDGSKILVDGKVVHEVRLSLMGRGVPISGGVGFEIFDNKDVGMTESMQKINYQRALQGELARTIMANDQLKSARVHLVVEEGGLFSRDKAHPKAAVSVVLKPGAHLNPDQILGIQRLVAAAVPGLDPAQVTLTDQRGIALSVEADTDGGGSATGTAASGKLRLKKQADEYLTRKVSEVLDRAFGPGQAIVGVDATLNFDEIRRTEQNILPIRGHGDDAGAVVRKRESIYRQGSQTGIHTVDTTPADQPADSPGALTSTNEIEYEWSKSAEQVVSTPGGIRRISVGVIVPESLNDDQLIRLREIVGMAVGFNAERGDAITVQPLARLLTSPAHHELASSAPASGAPAGQPSERGAADAQTTATRAPFIPGWRLGDTRTTVGLSILALVLAGVAVSRYRRRAAESSLQARTLDGQPLEGELSLRERQLLLTEIKSWIEADKVSRGGAIQG